MFILKTKLINDKLFSYSLFIFVVSCYLVLFYLSTKFIINDWTWSQAHTNYSYGYVKRGLFGTLILFFENNFNINTVKSFTNFFILLKLSNIFLFFLLINQYFKNKLLFLFLALNPLLIMFAFNDLGGYQRFDDLSVFLILTHSLILRSFNKNIISEKYYTKFLYLFIFPFLCFAMLIHEIVVWSLPFHFFLTYNVYKKLFNYGFFSYIILLTLTLFIFLYPVSDATFNNMLKGLAEKNLSHEPFKFSAQTKNNIVIIKEQIGINLLTSYNFIVNIFFLFMATFPFYYLFKRFEKKNEVFGEKIRNSVFILSTLPYLSFFVIGDTGRWLSLIAFTSLGIIGQYKFELSVNKENTKKFFQIPILVLVLIFCFFIQVPHLIKHVTIYGGIFQKALDGYNVFILKNNEDFYNLNMRFKNH
jgi:hypothetical protein